MTLAAEYQTLGWVVAQPYDQHVAHLVSSSVWPSKSSEKTSRQWPAWPRGTGSGVGVGVGVLVGVLVSVASAGRVGMMVGVRVGVLVLVDNACWVDLLVGVGAGEFMAQAERIITMDRMSTSFIP